MAARAALTRAVETNRRERPGHGWTRPPNHRPKLRFDLTAIGAPQSAAKELEFPNTYIIDQHCCRVPYIVMCNATENDSDYHVERASVYTHLLGVLIYAIYLSLRSLTPAGQSEAPASDWSLLATWASFTCLACSTVYHTWSPHRFFSAVFRQFDYFGIYFAISAGATADVVLPLWSFRGAPWQTVSDYFIAGAILWLYFLYRRSTLTCAETMKEYFKSPKCAAVYARWSHVDLEHSALRAAGGLVLSLSWLLAAGGVASTLASNVALVYFLTRVSATLLVYSGMFLDNVLMYPNKNSNIDCKYPTCGCVLDAHAIWHIISLVAMIVGTAGSDVAISLAY